MLTVGSLFAGIGGFDLGLERAGMKVIWQSEIDPYASAVLRKHWPEVPNHGDIRDITAATVERPDVLCGGFPCQDISVAGKGAGLAGDRSGLWFEYKRIIGELRPKFAAMENVSALLNRGLERVLGDLAEIGYDAEWDCLPVSSVGAPHQRDRVFILAYSREEREQRVISETPCWQPAFSWRENVRGLADLYGRSDLPAPIFRGTRDGVPNWMDRVGCLGNAIVPQIAEIIGRAIVSAHR